MPAIKQQKLNNNQTIKFQQNEKFNLTSKYSFKHISAGHVLNQRHVFEQVGD
jgi:hypothetical protein